MRIDKWYKDTEQALAWSLFRGEGNYRRGLKNVMQGWKEEKHRAAKIHAILHQ